MATELLIERPKMPKPKPSKAERPEETVVKLDRELVELIKFIVQARNRGAASGERLTISQYLADITRKTIVHDYNAEIRKVRPIKEDGQ